MSSLSTRFLVACALLAGLPEGAWVKYTTARVDGDNTLTSIYVVEECKRFQHCD